MLFLNPGISPPITLAPTPTRPTVERRRVLVVDDHEPTAVALARLMGLLGHETRVASDGPSALATVESYAPDLVLLDLGLPDVDGCAVARQMRADSRMTGVTLVALTGYGSDEDRNRVRDAGFDYHLLKPVTMRTLEAILELPARVARSSVWARAPIGQ